MRRFGIALTLLVLVISTYAADTYRVGLPSHEYDETQTGVEAQIKFNLELYRRHAEVAANNGVQIIVYPEFGLVANAILNQNREAILPYAEIVPAVGTNPSTNVSYPDFIMKPLSRFAQTYSILLVANVNELAYCAPSSDCPADGQQVYNTEIVFDETGTLIAKYRKQHPWFTSVYTTGAQPPVTFSSPRLSNVTFGLMVCNDIRFDDPKSELVKMGVKHFPYSVAMSWSLLQWALIQSFSWLEGVAVLSANYGYGDTKVYVKGSALSYEMLTLGVDTKDTLLVSDVPINF